MYIYTYIYKYISIYIHIYVYIYMINTPITSPSANKMEYVFLTSLTQAKWGALNVFPIPTFFSFFWKNGFVG